MNDIISNLVRICTAGEASQPAYCCPHGGGGGGAGWRHPSFLLRPCTLAACPLVPGPGAHLLLDSCSVSPVCGHLTTNADVWTRGRSRSVSRCR